MKKVLEMNKKNVRIKTLLFSELCKSASVTEVHGKCYINYIQETQTLIVRRENAFCKFHTLLGFVYHLSCLP